MKAEATVSVTLATCQLNFILLKGCKFFKRITSQVAVFVLYGEYV